MAAIIQLTFDGSLVRNQHQVAMRDLAKAMTSIQAAADRACIDVHYGNVWKHQRLGRTHYETVEFIVGEPREGSYVIDFVSVLAGNIVDRIRRAIENPYAEAVADADREIFTLGHQIDSRKDAARRAEELIVFDEVAIRNDPLITRSYGDRSISKEIAQMLTPVARETDGLMKLALKSDQNSTTHTFEFDHDSAKKFKRIVGERKLGPPVIYEGIVRELDKGTEKTKKFRGKFINAKSKKTVTLHIEDRADFTTLVPFLDKDRPFLIVAAPIIEFDSFDPTGGDIQFLQIYHG